MIINIGQIIPWNSKSYSRTTIMDYINLQINLSKMLNGDNRDHDYKWSFNLSFNPFSFNKSEHFLSFLRWKNKIIEDYMTIYMDTIILEQKLIFGKFKLKIFMELMKYVNLRESIEINYSLKSKLHNIISKIIIENNQQEGMININKTMWKNIFNKDMVTKPIIIALLEPDYKSLFQWSLEYNMNEYSMNISLSYGQYWSIHLSAEAQNILSIVNQKSLYKKFMIRKNIIDQKTQYINYKKFQKKILIQDKKLKINIIKRINIIKLLFKMKKISLEEIVDQVEKLFFCTSLIISIYEKNITNTKEFLSNIDSQKIEQLQLQTYDIDFHIIYDYLEKIFVFND